MGDAKNEAKIGMPKHPSEGSRPQVIETVEWIKSIGAQPVHLAFRSKAAAARGYEADGWVAPDTTHWKRHNLGVGIKTGPKSKGPIDADLDCPESLFFAPLFMPPTEAKIGRETKWDSHFFYLVPEAEFSGFKCVDPIDKTVIIELRGDGGNQTVMPGSLHQDTGEEVRWSKPKPVIPTVPVDEIIEGAKMTALASLIARHLWHEGSRNIVANHITGMLFYLDWPLEKVEKLIEAVVDYTGDTDRTRILAVRNTYKKGDRGAKITGATKLKAHVGDDRVVNKLMEWAGAPDMGFMSEYNERFAVVAVEGKFRVADLTGESPIYYGRDDFLHFYSTDKTTIITEDDKEKKVSKAAMWLASPGRRAYRNVDFLPGQDETKGILNLWGGWTFETIEGKPDPKRFKAWTRLMREVICGDDEKLYHWFINWLAGITQVPQTKPMTAPVIIGPPGAGKSLAISYFARCLGESYLPVTDPEHIHGRFNQHLASCLLLHSEEALYAGDKKHRSVIKSLITDPFRMYEPKNINAKRVPNYLRLILTSNDSRAAPVEAGDRRYTVAYLDKRKASPALIRDVLKEMHEDGPLHLFWHLRSVVKYDDTLAHENVKDEGFFTARQLNYTNIEGFWIDRLEHGEVLPDLLSWAQFPKGSDGHQWPACVSSAALYIAYVMWCDSTRERGVMSEYAFALELDKMVGIVLERNKRRPSYLNPWRGDQTAPARVRDLTERPKSITNMPSLVNCRLAFENYVQHEVEWPPEVEERVNVPPSARWQPQVIARKDGNKEGQKDKQEKPK